MSSEELDQFFRDPMVLAHIESFMDAHCSIFTCEKEIHAEHYVAHKAFSEMMKHLLLDNSSIQYNQIQEIYATYKITNEENFLLNSISYIIASWNFELFYQLMTLINVDLQLEALHFIQQKHHNQSVQIDSSNNNNDNTELMNNNSTTQINQNEITDMLLEKSQQKNGVMNTIKQTIQNELCENCQVKNNEQLITKIDSNIARDIPTTIHTNRPESKLDCSADTMTSSSSDDMSTRHNNNESIHQQKYGNTSKPTEDELVEKQAFLRKQRDLLVEIRRKKREQLLLLSSNQLHSSTDDCLKDTTNNVSCETKQFEIFIFPLFSYNRTLDYEGFKT
ncbi:unnamed protein product [Schistosoma turkestanicum]|nr:unnamed protein product [Schistosoma turkestanicum]